MTSLRSLTADRRLLDGFKARCRKLGADKLDASRLDIPLHVFEWLPNSLEGIEISGLKSVEELESRSQGTVRVVFAPQDVPVPETVAGFSELFERCGIPSAFIEEGLQGVSQSFGAQRDAEGTTYIWFHLLCKTIAVSNNRVVYQQTREDVEDVDNKNDTKRLQAQSQSQANFTWLKPGFVLKIREQGSSSLKPNRTTGSSSDVTLAATSTHATVEMFCFGAPVTLGERIRRLNKQATCNELSENPYIFLEIVLQDMYKAMDQTGWAISDIFGAIETQTLGMASKPAKATKELLEDHFTGLHNLAKHTIYLRENCDSALATLNDIKDYHNGVMDDPPSPSQQLTRQAVKYQKTLFESTQRRLASLDARMTNVIQLSFHIVTQGDSRLMQSENQSMKTIAVMTLIFMPLSTIATVFGTQFMKLQEDSPYHITVSRDFWLLWIIAIPLTVIVIVVWHLGYLDARGRLVDEVPEDEPGYMGWKTLKQMLRKENKTRKGQNNVAAGKTMPNV